LGCKASAGALKVSAGLSLLAKAQVEKETRIGIAAKLAKVQVPKIVIGGDGNGSKPASFMDAIGVNMLLEVIAKL
jgi:ABC-type amino acid transport substrate-binding protein